MREMWKDIEGYNGYYQVSNIGRVRSLKRSVFRKNSRGELPVGGTIMKGSISNGYKRVTLRKGKSVKYATIHSLVLNAFCPEGKKDTCNHKDGNKLNNNLLNLEWATYSENNSHAFRMLLKENQQKVLLDTEYGIYYYSVHEASNSYDYSRSYISRMINGVNPNKTSLVIV